MVPTTHTGKNVNDKLKLQRKVFGYNMLKLVDQEYVWYKFSGAKGREVDIVKIGTHQVSKYDFF